MSVYHDMANDAGYSFGTDENEQMAQMLYAQEQQAYEEHLAEEAALEFYYSQVHPWYEWWIRLGRYND